jgi:poly(3-hydroxybutyrate) depolymerase
MVVGDGDSAERHRKFYDEYLAVMDIPARFYLDTVEHVFKKASLPKGELLIRGKLVDPSKIKPHCPLHH